MFLLSAILAVVLLPSSATAHMIELAAGKKECFFEDLHADDKVHLLFTEG